MTATVSPTPDGLTSQSTLTTLATVVVVVVSLLLPPAIYAVVAYQGATAEMRADARVANEVVHEAMAGEPETWRAKKTAIERHIASHIASHIVAGEGSAGERLTVFDAQGQSLAVVGAMPAAPRLVWSMPVSEGGKAVGRVEVERSVRSLIVNAALLSLLGIALAVVSYITFRVMPLRTLNRANERLGERTEMLAHEIEEQKRVGAALRESEQIIRAILDTVPARVFWKDKNLTYLGCNEPFARDAGFDRPEDVVGKDDYRMGWHEQAELYRKDDQEVVDTGKSKLLIEEPQTTPDGRVITLLTNKVPLRNAAGEVFGMLGTYMDVTERQRAQEALRQSEARFKAIFERARDGIALAGAETKKFLAANDSLCQMLGRTRDEMLRLTIDAIHPADKLQMVAQTFERQARGEVDVAANMPIKRKDGSVFYADINSAPVEIGGKRYVLGIFRDVTARREAEVAVRQSEERYRGLVESTTDYIWEIDESGRYTYYTPAMAKLLGYEPDEIMGKTPFDLMPPAEAERVKKEFGAAAAHRPFSMLENLVVAKDGTEIVMETSGVPIFDKGGAFRGYRGIERDITQRKAAETKLKQRDALLHAVAASATELVTASSLDDALPKALETISRALQVDRMNVLERSPHGHSVPRLRYSWNALGLKTIVDRKFFEDPALGSSQLATWQSPLRDGKVVTAELRTATGDLKAVLERLDTKSLLVVPVMVDGKYWGQIGFDNCKSDRLWYDFEIEILSTVADLIGNAIQRDRYVTEITNANRIVQNTPTVLYRLRGVPSLPMIYISQNIKLFGYEPSALTESPRLYQQLIHPEDIASVRDKQAQSLESNNPRGVFEFRLMTASGDYRWVENRYSQIRDAAGRLTEIEGLLIDITDRKAAEEKIAQLARTDPLTGLANRNTFIERLRQSFVDARRGAPAFALLYIDLDRFKDINDTLGHPVGDSFLVEVSKRIKKSIRDTDLAGRLGGDEFAVLQSELAESADAGTLAEKIREALAEPYQIEGNTLHMTASLGIAIYESETKTAEDLLAQADIALYRAKEEGRDQYRFHTEELDIEVREQVELANELSGALNRGEFRLVYQPQVELSSGRIVGMEVLIRWQHPTRGLLSPSAFLAVAERTGAIGAIGRWVLDEACRQMHDWRKGGCAPATLAVNISPVEIKAGGEFVEFVRTTLDKWGLAPQTLELDVTESMLARATLTQNDVLERLQQIGVKISIDDFGTQYSSLDYLRTYRVNRLKIPQMLTSTAARDPENAAMVRAIVGIARELGIEVIAQGVESEREWAFLTATSPVSKVQGYYYSKPVSADRAEQLLRGGRLVPQESDRAGKMKREKS
ncbi:MAG: PAS domain S-box protein [Pseudolabrys sp.]